MVSEQRADGRTVLGYPVVDRLVLFVGVPALGVLLAAVLPPLARWLLGLSTGLLFRPLVRFLAAVDEPWEVAVALAVGLVSGLGVAFVAMAESATVTLTDDELRVEREDRTRTVAREDVDAVFLDGRNLVVLDRESRQLVRDPPRAPAAALAAAFRSHGYPWHDADPYADLFRGWTREAPGLPSPVDAVLAARDVALRKKAHRDARDLTAALEKLGYVVREEGVRQYWRPLVRS